MFDDLISVKCATCGNSFALTGETYRRRQEDGRVFFCPLGHENIFGESENDKLRQRIAQLEKELARQTDLAGQATYWRQAYREAMDTVRDLEAELLSARRRAGSYKGAWSRLKRKIETQEEEE